MQSSLLLVAMALGASACGGGNVDRGFYGDYKATARAERRVATRPTQSPATRSNVAFQRPKLIVIRAAWCHFCRTAEPSIMSAYAPYRGKIDLVVLDVTDDDAVERSLSKASDEGVRTFFEKYGARTPSVGVFVAAERGRLVHGDVADPEVVSRELEFSLSQFKGE